MNYGHRCQRTCDYELTNLSRVQYSNSTTCTPVLITAPTTSSNSFCADGNSSITPSLHTTSNLTYPPLISPSSLDTPKQHLDNVSKHHLRRRPHNHPTVLQTHPDLPHNHLKPQRFALPDLPNDTRYQPGLIPYKPTRMAGITTLPPTSIPTPSTSAYRKQRAFTVRRTARPETKIGRV